MNRVKYIEALFAGKIAAKLLDVPTLVKQCERMNDADFLAAMAKNIDDIAKPLGLPGQDKKYHFHCINCRVTLHLDWIPRMCLWCGADKKFLQLRENDVQG